MEDKKVASTQKITQELLTGWLLWGIIFGIFYTLLSNIIFTVIQNRILQAVIVILLQGVTMFFVWQSSIASTFKKRTMLLSDVPAVMKNLVIFTIIICIINGIYNYSKVDRTIHQAINSNVQLQLAEHQMAYLYDEDELAEYNQEKEEMIEETKKQLYIYLTLIEIGLTAIYLVVLPLEKKQILKYVIKA